MKTRFYGAMACYAILAAAAAFTLDGKFRIAVWVLLAAFAVRTWLAVMKGREN